MKKTAISLLLVLSFYIAGAQHNITDTNIHTSPIYPRHILPWWVQRFSIAGGIFIPVNNTVIKVGNEAGTSGTSIDFEKDLGFSTVTSTFLGNAQWRISRRSRLDFNYYNIARTSTHTLDKDIQFADTTYHTNAVIQAFFNTAIYELSYGYAIISRPTFEAGLMFGAHIVTADVGMGVQTSIGSVSTHKSFTFTAPLPDLGIWGGYEINHRWGLQANIGYLGVKGDDFSVKIIAYNAVIAYRATTHLHIIAGYTGLNFDVTIRADKLQGYLKWGYNGPSITARYAFGKKKWQA